MTYGLNPIRKSELDLDGTELHVEEIFLTLQGEGPFGGQRAVFVRLAGCSLACFWCDTFFEAGMNRPKMKKEEIVKHVHALMLPNAGRAICAVPLVVITGGEPTRQNIGPLCEELAVLGYHVQIETAGVHHPAVLDDVPPQSLTVVVSPKTPKIAAGWAQSVHKLAHWKFVVDATDTSDVDGLPVLSTQMEGRPGVLARPWDYYMHGYTVWVSPRDVPGDPDRTRVNTQHASNLCLSHGYRLSLQTHKLVGLP